MKIKAIQVRKGMVITFKNDLYRVYEATHVTPGKGNALMQIKMKRLSDGNKAEQRYRPDESVEKATLLTREFQYLYDDGMNFHFMDTETFEQIQLPEEDLQDARYYMLPETLVTLLFHDGKPIDIELPPSVELRVEETEPNMKGATATGSYKPAILETGLQTQIPPFVEAGEVIRVDTRDGKYMDRVK
ncbi:MAG TPA: elongation factor P [Calditrichia bacterium]|nr:elongation factor P [Calditrichota bacterium]HQU71546.1 elongation factor P [Calditrichia bacterium]HQV30552.1 elongation factor P [Calditrichia bacterium]